MTAWEGPVIPTVRPALMSSRICRAAVNVFPRPEPVQHGYLVRLAAFDQVLEPDVELPRLAQCSPGLQQVQPGHVLTRHEVGDVTGGQPEPVISELHAAPRISPDS